MHSIEEIIANAQSAAAASLRSAYEVGREHQTIEMRDKFVAFFEGVIGPFSKSAAPAPEPVAESVAEAPVDGGGMSRRRPKPRARRRPKRSPPSQRPKRQPKERPPRVRRRPS